MLNLEIDSMLVALSMELPFSEDTYVNSGEHHILLISRIYEGTLNSTDLSNLATNTASLSSPYFGLTTSPLSTGAVTSGEVTTFALTTQELTTSPITTSPVTTSKITAQEISEGNSLQIQSSESSIPIPIIAGVVGGVVFLSCKQFIKCNN